MVTEVQQVRRFSAVRHPAGLKGWAAPSSLVAAADGLSSGAGFGMIEGCLTVARQPQNASLCQLLVKMEAETQRQRKSKAKRGRVNFFSRRNTDFAL